MGWKTHISVKQIQPGRSVWLPPLILLFNNNNTVLCTQWTYVTVCKYITGGANTLKYQEAFISYWIQTWYLKWWKQKCCDHIKAPLARKFHPNQFWLQLVHLGDREIEGGITVLDFEWWEAWPNPAFCFSDGNSLQCSQPTPDSQSEFVHLMSPTVVFYFSLTPSIKALINKVIFPKQPHPGATRDAISLW